MPNRIRNRLVNILLVEDNPGDVLLVQEAFAEAGVECRIEVLTDGAAALAYLRQETATQPGSLPDLILLDLNLPKQNGHEVLRVVKTDARLLRIPVLVLTSSRAEQDAARSYELHANVHLCKPASLTGYVALARLIDSFWLKQMRQGSYSLV